MIEGFELNLEEIKELLIDSHEGLWNDFLGEQKDELGLIAVAKQDFRDRLDLLIELAIEKGSCKCKKNA